MTAEDVITSYRRILDPATGAASRSNYDMIERMEAPDPYTVIFRLSYAYGGFADILSDRQVKIVPADKLDELSTNPIGTGPYRFVEYKPDSHVKVARFDDYKPNPAY